MDPDRPVTSVGQGSLWLSYFTGAFGLAITQQGNFLVALRALELGASFKIIGLIIAAGAAAPALFSVPVGAVIDRMGPRRAFIVGCGGSMVVALTFCVITDWRGLLVAQFAFGVVRNLGWLASQAYVAQLGALGSGAATVGRFGFFSNASQMVAILMVGGVAQMIGFRAAFLFVAAYAALFALTGLKLKEISNLPQSHPAGTGTRVAFVLLRDPGIKAILTLTFVRLWLTWAWVSFFPAYLAAERFEPIVIAVVMATGGLVATLVSPMTGRLAGFMNEPTLATCALGCGATGLLLAPHVSFMPYVFVAPALVGIGQGVSLPVLLMLTAKVAPEGQLGIALGLRSTVSQTAAMAAPLSVGPVIAGVGIGTGFAVVSVVAGGLLTGAHFMNIRNTRKQAENSM